MYLSNKYTSNYLRVNLAVIAFIAFFSAFRYKDYIKSYLSYNRSVTVVELLIHPFFRS